MFRLFHSNANFAKIGHFTQLMQEEVQFIGCAIKQYLDGGFYYSLCACNYSAGNIIGRPVYRTGTPASLCTKGTHPTYTKLCSSSEVYDLND